MLCGNKSLRLQNHSSSKLPVNLVLGIDYSDLLNHGFGRRRSCTLVNSLHFRIDPSAFLGFVEPRQLPHRLPVAGDLCRAEVALSINHSAQ